MPEESSTLARSGETTTLTWGLISIGVLLRVTSYFFSVNSGGDAAARIGITALWMQQPNFRLAFGAYGPGHFWLIGLFSLVFGNVTTAGRALSLVLGIISIFLVWRLARSVYGKAAAVFSVAVFTFYSLHVGYSTTSSAEVPFLFMLLAALCLFFDYFQNQRTWWLAGSGLFLSAAESMRYEAWVFFFAMSVALLGLVIYKGDKDKKVDFGWSELKPLLAFGAAGGLWPVLVMAVSWRAYGDPLRSLTVHNELVTGWFGAHPVPLAHQAIVIPTALLISLSPIALLAAIFGLVKSFTSRLAGAFASIIVFFWLVQNYEIVSGKLLAMARYSLTLGTLLAVVAGFGLEQICIRLMPKRYGLAQTAVIALLFLNLGVVFVMSEMPTRFADKFAPMSPRMRYSRRIAEVGNYLKSHMGREDKVVIDDYNVESNLVAEAAGLPTPQRERAYLASAKNDVGVRDYIKGQRPRFMVYSDEGTLHESLQMPRGCSEPVKLEGISFQCRFAGNVYRVYELSYQ